MGCIFGISGAFIDGSKEAMMSKKVLVCGLGVLILVVAGALGLAYAQNWLWWSSPAKDPVFVFNQESAPGWWAANNYNSQASAREEDGYVGEQPIEKLPVASMNIFKGTPSGGETDCFVMYAYYDYKIDLVEEKRRQTSGVASEEATRTVVGQDTLSLTTPSGAIGYSFSRTQLAGPGAESMMRGIGLGFVDVPGGYVRIEADCPEASDLANIVQSMKAVSLKEAN